MLKRAGDACEAFIVRPGSHPLAARAPDAELDRGERRP
jgi:hypothetical protein